jgi:hypothetical protein
MLALDRNSRKRSARSLSSLINTSVNTDTSRKKTQHNKNNNRNDVPVICLTGLTTEEKDKYHQIIENLGGRYVDHTTNEYNYGTELKRRDGMFYFLPYCICHSHT